MTSTHSRVIEAEAKERQLEVKVLVNLLVRCVNVALQIALILGTALIEEPVHELTSEEGQALRCDDVASSIIAMSRWLTRSDAIIWICK